ncbi:conserved exported hypothetical protein [Nitrosomonas nitrosa]|jgi:Cu(I)/Ag(I) efflux system protein CusF|uniref:Cu and Ag efflux protein CusF n=1 Tax=Nitrosomonas nitrosa TaxID=52442 RepID=A0A1I4RVK9_9PROT|nr:copper-binding protein [Nitrosomonas nitrosa]CAE6482888.1 conserved exported hypothetical protein [Nitrosomonas nitrosa]SFM56053.1 Cu and Ag efflux protein CusF [Nitrosomonas nitrosa]
MKRNMQVVFINICAVFLSIGLVAMQPANATAASHEGVAMVKAIDLDKSIVKLAHSPIATLNWPAMTMNFKTKERTLLQGIKVGDVVTFTFIQANGDYVITHIQSDR